MEKTILVAEDSSVLRNLIKSIIEEEGFLVIACEDGEDAVQHIDKVSAVITDLIMPKMNGDQLAKVVRNRRPEMPILIMTGTIQLVPKDHCANKVVEKESSFENVLAWLAGL